jgi:hypothetical protein
MGSSSAMLGLEVMPGSTAASTLLLVLDFGAGQVLAVNPTTVTPAHALRCPRRHKAPTKPDLA